MHRPIGIIAVFVAFALPSLSAAGAAELMTVDGAPVPAAIDTTCTHGCARMTNWLARPVSPGVPVAYAE